MSSPALKTPEMKCPKKERIFFFEKKKQKTFGLEGSR
jgi:hypothetical protein